MNSLKAKLPPLGTLGPAIALALACAFFSFQHERFLTLQNFSLILQQVMVVGTIAIGHTGRFTNAAATEFTTSRLRVRNSRNGSLKSEAMSLAGSVLA